MLTRRELLASTVSLLLKPTNYPPVIRDWKIFLRDRNWPAYRLLYVDKAGYLHEPKITWCQIHTQIEINPVTLEEYWQEISWSGEAPIKDVVGVVLQNPKGQITGLQFAKETTDFNIYSWFLWAYAETVTVPRIEGCPYFLYKKLGVYDRQRVWLTKVTEAPMPAEINPLGI